MRWPLTTDAPPRMQWEPSSGSPTASQAVNCGPTGATQQADYYKQRRFPIEETRRLAAPPSLPTTAWQQVEMLRLRGVPCDALQIGSLAALDVLLEGSRRPVGIGVLQSRLSAKTRGHPFLGWHRWTLLALGRRWSWRRMRFIHGYVYTDPNFSPPGGNRPDPRGGHRFISRSELRYAYINHSPAWAIVPRRRKAAD